MYVLLEFWQNTWVIPIMNLLSWFMIGLDITEETVLEFFYQHKLTKILLNFLRHTPTVQQYLFTALKFLLCAFMVRSRDH